ncbi:GIY-YIG nuclease family protein [Hymenobacter aquaticus]|uniref:GIY-YIG nuclease family protein n=1 Tax=Hymenobacter aquaticus TaxID=1867101 RepID=A0A4Z0Q5B2_9BACT|nr:GIY-YIG nuclease family protein [Hymenobacter aquaticus]TGE24261.1 GIY-YIG nuclease family protein [Hymenobacter aquaticus]
MPITLNELLANRGLSLAASIKLVRHKDQRQAFDPHGWYRREKDRFLEYQSQQTSDIFRGCDYIVSFLGEENGRARFVGVFQVAGYDMRPNDPHLYYRLTEVVGFEDLSERVIINWGAATISWHQWLRPAGPDAKVVVEIQPQPFARPFKDYLDFVLDFDELKTLVKNTGAGDEWQRMLSAVAGIYLILDTHTGQQYIGSAAGLGGIWQRWASYVSTNGHGGNVRLEALLATDPQYARHFRFTILMTLPKTMTSKEVLARETLYKHKLGSRTFGLNLN